MRKSIFPSCVPIQMPALPAFVSPDVSCKSNFYSRRCRSQANLTSWGERTSVREGHKVKQIMCLLYEAVIPCVSTVDLLFVLKFSNRSFFWFFFTPWQFPPSAVLSPPVTVPGDAGITAAKGTSARS